MGLIAAALALALQTSPAAPPYRASGSEPFWSLEISGRRMVFSPNDGERELRAPRPRMQPTRAGYRLVTPRFTVDVRHVPCEDDAERRYRDTVRVTAYGRHFDGCGGTLLPPLTVANTDWRIEAIGAARVDGDAYRLSFHEGRISGQAGCNRLTGAYVQNGDRLTAGPIAATRMMCPPPRMAHERALLDILRGPVRVSYPSGDVMVLTGSGGTVRLRRV
jgi:heat shock protein HslJ